MRKRIVMVLVTMMVCCCTLCIAYADVGDSVKYEDSSNGSMSSADRIYDDDTVFGAIEDYDYDYYRFVLDEEKDVMIICASESEGIEITLYDCYGDIITRYSNGEYIDGVYTITLLGGLGEGTHYISITDENEYNAYNEYLLYFAHIPYLDTPAVDIQNVESSGKIKLTWNEVLDADKYIIERSASKEGPYQSYDRTASTTYTNTSTNAGKTYYYRVKAIGEYGESAWAYVSRTCDLPRPTGLKATTVASSGKPKVSWSAVDGASKYYVYRATSKNGTYTYLGSTANTHYTNTGAVAGNTYYYKVKAVHPTNEYAYSAQSASIYVTCDLPAPTNVKVSNNASSGKPKVSWTAVDGASKYYVYRATSKNGAYTYLGSTENTHYTNTGAVVGNTYYYKVKAVHPTNEYAYSAQSANTYITCDLPAPTNVKVSNNASSGKPKVSWTAVNGASKYYVYRATSKNGAYTYLGSTENTHYTNTGATAGNTYYYKVKAVHPTNEYAYSAQSSFAYITCDLAQPKNVALVLSSDGPKVTWDAVSGASTYEIYRRVGADGVYSQFYTTTNTSFTDVNTTSDDEYYYKVVAVCAKSAYGNSVYSSEVNTATL